ncbi:MAG: sugar phosphate nucleotidyltransferase [Candidatus Heimdallarchaeota archaeon]
MNQIRAVVLAGGEGLRLQPMTLTRPKPLLLVANYPMINYTLWSLKRAGIEDVVLVVKYLGNQIREYIGDGEEFDLNIVIPDIDPQDTADAVRKAANLLEDGEDFIVTMADLVTNVELEAFLDFHINKGGIGSIALKNVPDPLQFGVIMLDDEQKIILFLEKPIPQELYVTTLTFSHRQPVYLHLNLINTGIYAFKHELLDILDSDANLMDFGAHVFPYLLRENYDIFGFVLPDYTYWMDCGSLQKVLWANWDVIRRYTWPYLPKGEERDGSWWGKNIELGKTARVSAPVVIGHEVKISEGVEISKHTTIADNCSIGNNSKINAAVLWNTVTIGTNTRCSKCIICANVTIGDNVVIEENVVVGEGSQVKNGARIEPNTLIAPNSIIE